MSAETLSPSRREAIAALVGLPALAAFSAALQGCAKAGNGKVARFDGGIVGGNAGLGHLLRGGDLLTRPVVRRERVGTAILGAGASGLAAGWALRRSGEEDFRVYELEDRIGGTALSGENAVSRHPWGAHYVPVPVSPNPPLESLLEEVGALTGRDHDGRPEWAEDMLCREPEERLFFRGAWYEGLYPSAGADRADAAERNRFDEEIRRLAATRDGQGRKAFALPRRLSSTDPDTTGLDRLSMRDWMDRGGFRSSRLRWFVEYGCRDDFGGTLETTSAWAGLHYFAARLPATRSRRTGSFAARGSSHVPSWDEPAPFLTWPEGNGRLISQLAKSCAGRLKTSALVFDVRPPATDDGDIEVRYFDPQANEVVAVLARHAIYALPKFTTAHLIAPWRASPPGFLSAFVYVPWMVANLTLDSRPKERGFPMAWDNVLYDSRSLGYVVATHQKGMDHGPTVLTYYLPLTDTDPKAARATLLGATYRELADATMADLATAHPDLPAHVRRLDIYRWGHAMVRPRPGFVWGRDREQACQPLGRILFAHTDLAGLPLFEEALDSGVRAAEVVLRDVGKAPAAFPTPWNET